ncbi:PAS domain S-box protein [Ammoniphilus sp. 3BR4]|uniref:PAS domain-containing sensor histidine kinase n=1 Tax=Ammoniphilus sp. 3BR4 TaxID=3158265 RepID=UPI003467AD7E
MFTKSELEDQYLFSRVFDHAPIGMALVTPEGRLIKVNPSLCNMLGYSENELIQHTIQSITHPDDLELNMEFRTKAVKGEINSYRMEKRYIHKSGKTIWGLLSVTVERDHQGNIGYFISQLVDITEQKAKEEELRKIQELHQIISENSQDMIVCLTSEGIVSYVSHSIHDQLGYNPEEFLGKNAYDFWHPEDVDNWVKQENQDSRKIVYRIRHKNGHYVWQEALSKKIRNDAGQIQHVIGICRDITERRQTEELIRRSEKLSVVGELAAGIAHEIRNPLTSLRGFIQLFKSEDTLGVKRLRHEIMLSEIDRINEIVGELLVLAKPSQEQYNLRSITEMLNDIITLLEAQANLLDVEIKKEFDSELPLVVCNSSIKQVFINLLKNAMESMPHGGKIFIQAKKMDDKICIRVIDQGEGIPQDQLLKIGQPFYTTKETGTGLGLMVSQRIILNHKGTMHIESEWRRGTTVEITIPLINDTKT